LVALEEVVLALVEQWADQDLVQAVVPDLGPALVLVLGLEPREVVKLAPAG
jgi:hypothetical protein